MEHLAIQTNNVQHSTYRIRTETLDGRKHLVVPVVMMVEGVHAGSRGPLLHGIDELGKYPESWNGIPVTINHPQENGSFVSANSPEQLQMAVGKVFHTHVNGEKLKAEAWIDEKKITAVSAVALAHIRDNKPLEVSVGVFTDEEVTAGNWNEESYDAVARNHRPDHLALLPGGVGACSWQDGCGIRVNKNQDLETTMKGGEQDAMTKEMKIDLSKFGVHSFQVDKSLNERITLVRQKLNEMDTENVKHYLTDVFQNHFIYEVEMQGEPTALYKQDYKVEDEKVVLEEDRKKVRRNVTYPEVNEAGDDVGTESTASTEETNSPETNKGDDPAGPEKEGAEERPTETGKVKRTKFSNNSKEGGQKMSDEKTPCFIAKVDALINNEQTQFTDEDKDWLMVQEESTLNKLEPVEPEEPKEAPKPVEVNKEQAVEVLKETLKTPDEFIQLMPAEMQDQMKSGLKLHQEKRNKLVNHIKENSGDGIWADGELEKEGTDRLEKLASMVKEKSDYSAMSINTDTSDAGPEPMYPAGIEVESK